MAYNDIRIIGNDTEIDRLLNRVLVSQIKPAYVEIGEDNVCLPIAYKDFAERNHTFRVREDDIYLTAFPRTGTTWTQEMIWLIVNNLDYEGAKKFILHRFPFFDAQSILSDNELFQEIFAEEDSLQKLDKRQSPRCIKTHFHWDLLPEDITSGRVRPKMISVLRNAKDTCVSSYHESRIAAAYKGTFEEFCELFLAGRVQYAPYWKTILSIWNRREKLDILFIRYKDMKENLQAVIKKVASFLGKDITEDQVQRLSEHLSFENMKKNTALNYDIMKEFSKRMNMSVWNENTFIRAGIEGGYNSFMSKEMIARFDAWTDENLKGTGLVMD